jgi:hypothetical protein
MGAGAEDDKAETSCCCSTFKNFIFFVTDGQDWEARVLVPANFFQHYDNTDNGFTYKGTQLCNISGYSTCKFILFVVISKVILSKISYTYSLL